MCFLAVDNPSGLSEHEVVQQILSYLETDTVFFISDVINCLSCWVLAYYFKIEIAWIGRSRVRESIDGKMDATNSEV